MNDIGQKAVMQVGQQCLLAVLHIPKRFLMVVLLDHIPDALDDLLLIARFQQIVMNPVAHSLLGILEFPEAGQKDKLNV